MWIHFMMDGCAFLSFRNGNLSNAITELKKEPGNVLNSDCVQPKKKSYTSTPTVG